MKKQFDAQRLQRGFPRLQRCQRRGQRPKGLLHCNGAKCASRRYSNYTQKEWRADNNGLSWKAPEHRKQEMTEISFSPVAGAWASSEACTPAVCPSGQKESRPDLAVQPGHRASICRDAPVDQPECRAPNLVAQTLRNWPETGRFSAGSVQPLPRVQTRLHPLAKRVNGRQDRKSTRLNSSHRTISYAVFC